MMYVYRKKRANKKKKMGLKKIYTGAWGDEVTPTLTSTSTYRQNEMGTPYRVLADEGMLESGVVRLQDRDTTIQVHVQCIYVPYLASPSSILPEIVRQMRI